MATLYKQPGSANWYAKYFDANGKRVAKSTGTPKKREAAKIAADFEAAERERKRNAKALPRQFAAIIEAAAREAAAGSA